MNLILTNVHLERNFEGSHVSFKFSPTLGSVDGYSMQFDHGDSLHDTITRVEELLQGLKVMEECSQRGAEPQTIATTLGHKLIAP